MKALALLPLLALSGAQGANDSMPPPGYQGNAVATVFFLHPDDVHRVCSNAAGAGPGYLILACARQRGESKGVMALPNPCPYGAAGERYAEIVCHEQGHLNGWRHD